MGRKGRKNQQQKQQQSASFEDAPRALAEEQPPTEATPIVGDDDAAAVAAEEPTVSPIVAPVAPVSGTATPPQIAVDINVEDDDGTKDLSTTAPAVPDAQTRLAQLLAAPAAGDDASSTSDHQLSTSAMMSTSAATTHETAGNRSVEESVPDPFVVPKLNFADVPQQEPSGARSARRLSRTTRAHFSEDTELHSMRRLSRRSTDPSGLTPRVREELEGLKDEDALKLGCVVAFELALESESATMSKTLSNTSFTLRNCEGEPRTIEQAEASMAWAWALGRVISVNPHARLVTLGQWDPPRRENWDDEVDGPEAKRMEDEIEKSERNIRMKETELGDKMAQLKEEARRAIEHRQKTEAELESVQPLLDEAKQAIDELDTRTLHELKSYTTPPPMVKKTLECVLTFLGQPTGTWENMRSFLRRDDALATIRDFNPRNISQSQLDEVTSKLDKDADLTQERADRASKAAGAFFKWATAMSRYATVFIPVMPIFKELEQIKRRSEEIEEEKIRLQQELLATEEDLGEQRDEYDDFLYGIDNDSFDATKAQLSSARSRAGVWRERGDGRAMRHIILRSSVLRVLNNGEPVDEKKFELKPEDVPRRNPRVLNADIEALADRLEKAQKERALERERAEELKRLREEADAKATDLAEEAAILRGAMDSRARDADAAAKTAAGDRAEADRAQAELKEKLAACEAQLAAARTSRDDAVAEAGRHATLAASLQATVDAMLEELNALKASQAQLIAELDAAKAENGALRVQLAESEADHASKSTALNAELAKTREELESIASRLAESDAENARLADLLVEAQKQLAAAQSDASATGGELQDRIKQLQKSLDDERSLHEELQKTVAGLRSENTSLRGELAEVNAKAEAAAAAATEEQARLAAELRDVREDLAKQLADAREALAALEANHRETVAALEEERTKFSRAVAEKNKLAADIKERDATIVELRKALLAAQTDSTASAAEQQKQIQELRAKLSAVEEDASELRGQVAALEGQRDKLEAALKNVTAEEKKATEQLRAAKASMAKAQENIQSLEADGAAKAETIRKLQEDLAAAKRERDAALEECKERLADLNRSKQQIENLTTATAGFAAEQERLKGLLERSQADSGATAAELQSQVARLTARKEALKAELKQHREESREKAAALEIAVEKVEQKYTHATGLIQEHRAALEGECAKAREARDVAVRELRDLRNRLAEEANRAQQLQAAERGSVEGAELTERSSIRKHEQVLFDASREEFESMRRILKSTQSRRQQAILLAERAQVEAAEAEHRRAIARESELTFARALQDAKVQRAVIQAAIEERELWERDQASRARAALEAERRSKVIPVPAFSAYVDPPTTVRAVEPTPAQGPRFGNTTRPFWDVPSEHQQRRADGGVMGGAANGQTNGAATRKPVSRFFNTSKASAAALQDVPAVDGRELMMIPLQPAASSRRPEVAAADGEESMGWHRRPFMQRWATTHS